MSFVKLETPVARGGGGERVQDNGDTGIFGGNKKRFKPTASLKYRFIAASAALKLLRKVFRIKRELS